MDRTASISRTTSETDIAVTLNLDGSGRSDIDTGIGFFDHMLRSFAKHGFFDLTVQVKGDLEVDCHHTIEDTGILLGAAIKKSWIICLADGRDTCFNRSGFVRTPLSVF